MNFLYRLSFLYTATKSQNSYDHEAGLYRVEWNGKNDYGEYVSSGIYFYRLEAGDFVATKKIVLVR